MANGGYLKIAFSVITYIRKNLILAFPKEFDLPEMRPLNLEGVRHYFIVNHIGRFKTTFMLNTIFWWPTTVATNSKTVIPICWRTCLMAVANFSKQQISVSKSVEITSWTQITLTLLMVCANSVMHKPCSILITSPRRI